MAGPLLETKLHVPRWRRGLVARPRLSERLSRGAKSALTLVSAPAGFGKTTLWRSGWLSLRPVDGPWRGFRLTSATTIPCCSGRTLSLR
jgi:LuxR family transcriptional regulator, maltose regulon positive regulatory protein